MSNGRYKKSESKLVPVWFPTELLPLVNDAVRRLDTDRSKFIRNAVREKIQRDLGTQLTPK